jgi:WXG100 family type VII secretion target
MIKVTPEQLHQLSGNVGRGAADIDGTLRVLGGQIAPLVAGDWGGQAAVQFHAMWDQWQQAARQLGESLQGISTLLDNAGTSYAQAESAIASTFRAG